VLVSASGRNNLWLSALSWLNEIWRKVRDREDASPARETRVLPNRVQIAVDLDLQRFTRDIQKIVYGLNEFGTIPRILPSQTVCK